jgi:LysM repeat protein
MKYLKLSAILAVALFSGCAGGGAESAATSASSNKVNSDRSAANTLIAADAESDRAGAPSSSMNANAASTAGAMNQETRSRRTVKNVVQKTTLAQAQVVQQAPVTIERKVIRNADLQLETADPEGSQQKIASIADAKGGYVVESNQSTSDPQIKKRDTVTMSLRVPADRFQSALDEIRSTADTVLMETVKGEDVTEEFIDVEARLKAQKALEQQYLEIMKRASSVEDALYVQGELAEVRGEIEKVEGRKRYLENQSSLSTIKIKLQTPAAISASSSNFNSRLAESFGSGLDVALNFVLGLVTLLVGALPFALFIGLPGFLIVRHFWQKQRRPLSVTEIAKDEIGTE